MKFPEDFNYHSREWVAFRELLEKDHETTVGKLCNLECTQTTTDQLRGRVHLIKDILQGADAAVRERLR